MSEPACHAIGCATPIPAGRDWCSFHWRMIPRRLQARIYHAKTAEEKQAAQAAARQAVECAEFGERLL